MKHKHAELMALYAQDAMETARPWERWEVCVTRSSEIWEPLEKSPVWYDHHEYRRKPKTIRIGEYDVPEPLREAPTNGTIYYVPFITLNDVVRSIWDGSPFDQNWLDCGLCHSTKQAAELHCKALLSFTVKEGTK